MLARLRQHEFKANAWPYLRGLGTADPDAVLARLDGEGIAFDGGAAAEEGHGAGAIGALARAGFVEFVGGEGAVVLTPCRTDFVPAIPTPPGDGSWRLSRFTYMHLEADDFVVRNPVADCFLEVNDGEAQALLHSLRKPRSLEQALSERHLGERGGEICAMLVRAGVILPCDSEGRTLDETEPSRRLWDFHDLLFHSLSRLGRSEKKIGATYAFEGDVPPPPALKPNPWSAGAIPLVRPDLAALARFDLPLTAAIEGRRSIRQHSIVPLSAAQLGEFLFRTMRVRHCYGNAFGEFTSRPYPSGGALYEQELYVVVDACLDLPRGFYYYDPLAHAVCPISGPDPEMEALLQEATTATAQQGRPQILLIIASRFDRFNWKYSSMAYAAQLKNVGVIYQTMYLVATAMNIAGCALGLGNTDRLCKMAGLDYLAEGSIGEFMLGRPL